MIRNIKVSIIVPIYNVEKYILKCLNSLNNQTLEDIEVILVNDGSTDKSGEICKKFIKENKIEEKFKYFEKNNGGLSDARNYGINYASGEYICFIDSDDYVDISIYEKMYALAKSNNSILVECEFFYVFPNYKKIEKLPQHYSSINEYLINSSVVAWNKLINRKWFIEQNISFPKGLIFEDLDFFFKLYSKIDDINKIATLNEPLIFYIQRSESITNKNLERMKEIVIVYQDVYNYLIDNNLFDKYKNELEYKMARNLLGAFLKRVLKINEKKKRKEIICFFWDSLNSTFPNWKKNCYIKNSQSPINIYLKYINKKILNLFIFLK